MLPTVIKHELRRLLHLGRATTERRGWFCLDEAEVVAFAEGGLEGRARRRAERHLARCPYCLGQLAFAARAEALKAPAEDVARFLERASRSRAKAPGWLGASRPSWAFLTAAAGVVLLVAIVVLWHPVTPPSGEDQPVVRNGVVGALAPTLVEPAEGQAVRPTALAIRWRPVPEALHYRVTLVTAAGDVVWQRRTDGTSVRPPPSVDLGAGESYFVWVEADLRGGGTVSSEVVGFRTAPG